MSQRGGGGGGVNYKIKYVTEHHIWYAIVTCGLRDIYATFKSTALSVYQDICI